MIVQIRHTQTPNIHYSEEPREGERERELECLLFVLKQINNKMKQRIRGFKTEANNRMRRQRRSRS